MTIGHLPPLPDGTTLRMERELFVRLDTETRGRAKRHRLVAAGIAVLLVGGGAGIAAVTIANQKMQARTAYCYSAPDANSRFAQAGIPDEMTGPDGHTTAIADPADRFAAAIENCAAAWRVGVFSASTAPAGTEFAVPPLVACLRPDQVPAVFPRPEGDTSSVHAFCTDLGMSAPPRH
ncbi:hypothetical protein [Leifsonia poae]|uniref:hypothetical protein n=1 Tax=Leifsonia poae TaxID=110933 RepID=UPI001CBF7C53|nr:hypothetical protein [Leifsonia poae]